uniref:Uncharacterized protein n=1 Tax=Rhizophora mucronata TaxID=61149 RepID=A0A2P2IW05_RHIMU
MAESLVIIFSVLHLKMLKLVEHLSCQIVVIFDHSFTFHTSFMN